MHTTVNHIKQDNRTNPNQHHHTPESEEPWSARLFGVQ